MALKERRQSIVLQIVSFRTELVVLTGIIVDLRLTTVRNQSFFQSTCAFDCPNRIRLSVRQHDRARITLDRDWTCRQQVF